jgi:hypothetical protein
MLSCRHHITTALLFSSLSIPAQPPVVKNGYKQNVLSIAYFIESANNSVNSLNGLLKKDNYRNKITSLNNPANNELGFSLKNEILNALKPLLAKAKKTDSKKFKDVIENFLSNPEENGIGSVKKYLPALGIFSTVLSLVGNLVIMEKTITQQDLNEFVIKIQQYFVQYEKLNAINEEFAQELQDLLEKSEEAKEELTEFLVECISMMNSRLTKQSLKEMPVESLIQKYYDPQKLQMWFDTAHVSNDKILYPPDAPTSVKLLTSQIKKLQKEFESVYQENYRQLKELIASLKTAIPNLDQEQIQKTNAELERLYSDSRQADMINLNIMLVDERMNTVCRNINSGN